MPRVAIIGVGRVGGALSIALRGSSFQVVLLTGREVAEIREIDAEILLVTTPDQEIRNVATVVAGRLRAGAVALHTSGSFSSEEFSPLAEVGIAVGSMHPLISISSAELGAKHFAGAFFCVEGDERAVAVANHLVAFLGGKPFQIDSANKALYHAAAVTACGHLTALIDLALTMMTKAGVDQSTSSQILQPLIESTIANIADSGTRSALTGTFARADAAGFRRQLAAFEGKVTGNELDIYLDLAKRSLELAKANGADHGRVAEIENLLSMAQRDSR